MAIAIAKRTFKFNDKTLPDPDPMMTNEEVISFYAGKYPELTSGFVEEIEPQEDGMIVKIGYSVGNKG